MAMVRRDGGRVRLVAMTALATALCGALAMPVQARVPGKDGAFTVSAANTTINTTTTLSAGATAGATTITVGSAAGITAGDVLMLHQAQGATISTANANTYGAVTALGNAGRYEYVSVPSTIAATMPPVLPFQAAGTIDAPALTVRLLYCGTRTTCAPPL
jgi:hypothetical protein